MSVWVYWDKILIRKEKKRLFSRKTKNVEITIYFKDIEEIYEQEWEGAFSGLGFSLKSGGYEYFLKEDATNLEQIYQDILEKRNEENPFRIIHVNTETGDEVVVLE